MATRLSFRLLVFLSIVLLVFAFLRLYNEGYLHQQTLPFSREEDVEKIFESTPVELACLNGLPIPEVIPDKPIETKHLSSPDSKSHLLSLVENAVDDLMPNIVHFIFGLKNPLEINSADRFGFIQYLAVRSAIVSLKPDEVFLHYTYISEPPSSNPNDDPLTNPWIRRLSNEITLVHHMPNNSESNAPHYAHLADLMRLDLISKEGGIYLDIDVFTLRSFDTIRQNPRPHDIVLGFEGGHRWGLCNAVIVARPNSSFVTRWIHSYENVDLSSEWNYHSVILPKAIANENPADVCTLPPDAFFWPTWSSNHIDWMHVPLSKSEARHWKKVIQSNNGALFPNQLAYHAWNQLSYSQYLSHLSPKIIVHRDTRFNLLVRRFVEKDLLEEDKD